MLTVVDGVCFQRWPIFLGFLDLIITPAFLAGHGSVEI